MGLLELVVALNGLSDHRKVKHDASVVYLLVQVVVDPLGFVHRELGELLLDRHLGFNIAEVIGLEGGPFLRRVLRLMEEGIALLGLGRGAEVSDEVFALLELLLFQAKHGTDTFQRKRQAEGSSPHHCAAP